MFIVHRIRDYIKRQFIISYYGIIYNALSIRIQVVLERSSISNRISGPRQHYSIFH